MFLCSWQKRNFEKLGNANEDCTFDVNSREFRARSRRGWKSRWNNGETTYRGFRTLCAGLGKIRRRTTDGKSSTFGSLRWKTFRFFFPSMMFHPPPQSPFTVCRRVIKLISDVSEVSSVDRQSMLTHIHIFIRTYKCVWMREWLFFKFPSA